MSCLVSPEMIITGRVIDAEEALHIGYLQLGPISMQELEAMHVAHPPRKVGAPATFLALRMLGQPRPHVRGYRTLACIRRAGTTGSPAARSVATTPRRSPS